MIHQIVAAVILAESVVFGIVAFVLFRKKRARLAQCRRTWGDVIEVKEHSGTEGPTRHPVIRYQTSAGEVQVFESKFGRSNWNIKPGDRLEILVNPNHPADAEVVNFMAQWGLLFMLAIVSVGSLIAAPLVYLLLRR